MKERIEEVFLNELEPSITISCLIRKSNRARRINLRIRSRDRVVLTLPRWENLKSGYSFLEKQKKWLDRAVRKLPVRCSLEEYFLNKGSIWLGENYHHLVWSKVREDEPPFHEILHDKIKLYLPRDKQVEDSILVCLSNLAKENLTNRLNMLSQRIGLSWNKVRIGNQRSRWGSCSAKGTISLNWRLLLLPYKVGNYVILHELAHLRHLNHSKEFWEYLSEICLDAKILDVQLRKAGQAIIGLGHH